MCSVQNEKRRLRIFTGLMPTKCLNVSLFCEMLGGKKKTYLKYLATNLCNRPLTGQAGWQSELFWENTCTSHCSWTFFLTYQEMTYIHIFQLFLILEFFFFSLWGSTHLCRGVIWHLLINSFQMAMYTGTESCSIQMQRHLMCWERAMY